MIAGIEFPQHEMLGVLSPRADCSPQSLWPTAVGGVARHLKILGGTACLLFLAACSSGGFHIYDKTKDESAQALKEEKEAIDIRATFVTARTNLDKLLEHELAIRAEHNDLRRRRVLRDIFYWDQSVERTVSQSFVQCSTPGEYDAPCPYIRSRLIELGISDQTQLRTVAIASGLLDGDELPSPMVRANEGIADVVRELSRTYGWHASCADVETFAIDSISAKTDNIQSLALERKVPEDLREAFVDDVTALTLSCFQRAAQLDKIDALKDVGGSIRSAYNAWVRAKEELKALQAACETARNALQNSDKYGCTPDRPLVASADSGKKNEAQQSATQDEPPTGDVVQNGGTTAPGAQDEGAGVTAGLQNAARKLSERIEDSASYLEFLGLNAVLTENRVSALETLLVAFNSGSLDEDTAAQLTKDPTLHRAAVVAAGLPGIGNEIEQLATFLKAPAGRAGLALQLAQQQLQLKYFRDRIEIEVKGVQLAQALLQSYTQEARLLYNAAQSGDRAGDFLKKPWTEVLGHSGSQDSQIETRDNRRQAVRALLFLDQSIAVSRSAQEALAYRLIDLDHRRAVLADEFSALSWLVLVDGPVDQIATFHSAGIKPEEIAQLIQGLASLGLLGYVALEVD